MTRGPVSPQPGTGPRRCPAIETRQHADCRITLIRRPDGSSLTVTVPNAAMNDETGAAGTESWIRENGDRREPPTAALLHLAALVTGGRRPRRTGGSAAPVFVLP